MKRNCIHVIILITMSFLTLYYHLYVFKYKQQDVYENYFGMCLHVKDEQHEDIIQWIDYHHRLGANKIYVVDDGSGLNYQYTSFINPNYS